MREQDFFYPLARLLLGICYRGTRHWAFLLVGLVGAALMGCSAESPKEVAPESSGDGALGEIEFSEHLIMNEYAYPFGICAGDLDRDGELDLTSADALPNNNLYWFETMAAVILPATSSRRMTPNDWSGIWWGT